MNELHSCADILVCPACSRFILGHGGGENRVSPMLLYQNRWMEVTGGQEEGELEQDDGGTRRIRGEWSESNILHSESSGSNNSNASDIFSPLQGGKLVQFPL